jgi:hypothetical protein
VASHHFPLEVLSVRLDNPVDDAHPAATAPLDPGQVTSERVAFGEANGVKEPATLPFFTTMSDMFKAPVTLNAGLGTCVHGVGLWPAGDVQVIFNLPGLGAGSATPLKMVAQLLADPEMLNVRLPAIVPSATKPPVVMHGLAVLPRTALMTKVSVLAVPPFISGGLKLIVPFHTPPEGLQVTWPGRFVGFETA